MHSDKLKRARVARILSRKDLSNKNKVELPAIVTITVSILSLSISLTGLMMGNFVKHASLSMILGGVTQDQTIPETGFKINYTMTVTSINNGNVPIAVTEMALSTRVRIHGEISADFPTDDHEKCRDWKTKDHDWVTTRVFSAVDFKPFLIDAGKIDVRQISFKGNISFGEELKAWTRISLCQMVMSALDEGNFQGENSRECQGFETRLQDNLSVIQMKLFSTNGCYLIIPFKMKRRREPFLTPGIRRSNGRIAPCSYFKALRVAVD